MKFITTAEEKEMEAIIKNGRKQLLQSFEQGYQTQEGTLDIFMKSVDHCSFNGFDHDKILWNTAAFINILSLDLKHIIADLLLSESDWKRRLHARHASMLMYESTSDLFLIMGKPFKNIIRKLSNYNSLEERLKVIRQQLNLFKDNHEAALHQIRNVATAHRDENVKLQFDTITRISWLAVFKQSQELDAILNALGPIMQEIIDKSVDELNKNEAGREDSL